MFGLSGVPRFQRCDLAAVNVFIAGCLMWMVREERRQMQRSKSKVTKRHSMMEIFEQKEDVEEKSLSEKLLSLDDNKVSIAIT